MSKLWIENLDQGELEYIQNRYSSEYKKFTKAYKNGLIVVFFTSLMIFIILIIISFYTDEAYKEEIELGLYEPITIEEVILYSVISLVGITIMFSIAFSFGYLLQLYNLKKDVDGKTKTIEITNIIEKKYMPHNDSYHFIIESQNKHSLEVDKDTYVLYADGDEINLEYTTYSKIDLGYY